MLTQSEFIASVKNMGLRDALYFARLLGVTMATALQWVKQLPKK